jgi:hypothetical protein
MSKYAWPETYCHGNDESYRIVIRWVPKAPIFGHGRYPFPYESTVGPFTRKNGTEGWSVAWMIWRHPNQILEGCEEDIEPIICAKCGFIFQGVIS